ncbi:MAG: hypothetical protein LUD84_09655 [Clostridiales bacterium]|nr:hypothetical protein [Clostridiales bacterium]
MKTITIDTLELRNFKGCPSLRLELGGRNCSIYGENAAGKTTIYDALTWLLFGKDSKGQTKFHIKPLDGAGEVLDHGAETSVEAILLVDGQPLTLRRTYFELWTQKRGRAGKSFDGNSSEFFVDGVPLKKNEYDRRIGELVEESTFRALTDVTWFCAGMDENSRRAALFDLIGGADEGDILNSDPQFAPLAASMAGRTVEDTRKALQAQRRSLNTKRNTIPARLDECKRTVTEYCDLDFASLRQQREELAGERDRRQRELDNLRSSDSAKLQESQLTAVQAQLDKLEAENDAHRAGQQDPDAVDRAKRELDRLERNTARLTQEQSYLESDITRMQEQVEQCRSAWKAAAAEQFTPGRCPTCGQAFPRERVEEARQKFQTEQAQRKALAISQANEHKQRLEETNRRLDSLREELRQAAGQKTDLMAQLTALEGQEVTNLPGYAAQKDKLTQQVAELQEQIRQVRQDSAGAISAARDRFLQASQTLRDMDGVLAGEQVLQNAQSRQQELTEAARKAAAELEDVDALLALCDQFTTAKAAYIDQRVNSLFRRVRWKLFDTQINGALVDCCRATVGGVPYSDLNSGEKVNAGLDVIDVLSRANGVRVPLFVDNAESVTHLLEVDTQVIRLVASKGDKTLREVLE